MISMLTLAACPTTRELLLYVGRLELRNISVQANSVNSGSNLSTRTLYLEKVTENPNLQ